MKKQKLLVVFVCALASAAISCSTASEDESVGTLEQGLVSATCNPDKSCCKYPTSTMCCSDADGDSCCEGTFDMGGKKYRVETVAYLDFFARSNGACTGSREAYGTYQCAQLVKNFYSAPPVGRLNHGFATSWGSAAKALDAISGAVKGVPADLQKNEDPVFVFYRVKKELPRETDALVFSGNGSGHIVIVRHVQKISNSEYWLTIIEQNVAFPLDFRANNGADMGGSTYNRVLRATRDSFGVWNVNSGLGQNTDGTPKYTYEGFIRHNLAGIYGDTGWHSDGTSQAFRNAYLDAVNNGIVLGLNTASSPPIQVNLGWGMDNGGSPFVHQYRGLWLQDLVNTDSATNRVGADGQSMLILNPDSHLAYPVVDKMLGGYRCLVDEDPNGMGGTTFLGAPIEKQQYGIYDQDGKVLDNGSSVLTQRFQKGYMWWGKCTGGPDPTQECLHVHSSAKDIPTGWFSKVITNKAPNCGNVLMVKNAPGANNVCTDQCVPSEQRCASSYTRRFCGKLDTDTCYTWIDQSCAGGQVCMSGNCVTPDPPPSTSSCTDECVYGTKRCQSTSISEFCSRSSTDGCTKWFGTFCSSSETCVSTSGSCTSLPPASAPATPPVVAPGNTLINASYVTPFSGMADMEACWKNPDGTNRAWGPVGECLNLLPTGGKYTCSFQVPTGTTSLSFQFYLSDGTWWRSSNPDNGTVSFTTSSETLTIARSDNNGFVANVPSLANAPPPPVTPPPATPGNTLITMSYDSAYVGTVTLEAWWQLPNTQPRSWGIVAGCQNIAPVNGRFTCTFEVPSGSTTLEFNLHLSDGSYWRGFGSEYGTVSLKALSNDLSYTRSGNNGLVSVVP